MQIPIKIPTGSIQEIEYFTFSYIHGSWLFILWFQLFAKNTGFEDNQMSLAAICEKYRLRGEANIPGRFSGEAHLTVLETGIFRK
jgi:hypothetical protein